MGRRVLAVATLACLLVASVALGGWTAASGATAPDPRPGSADPEDPPDDGAVSNGSAPPTDNTITRIRVYRNGSARWTVRVRTRLDDQQRVEEFEAFQQEVRENPEEYLGPFRKRITRVVSNAANETGREMRADSFSISTRIQPVPRRWGVVTYEFRWTNFARESGDRVVVGDVFQGGFYLAENDTVEVVPPDGYAVEEVDPATDAREDGRLSWSGETDFADGRPRVAFAPVTTAATTGGGRTDGGSTGTTGTTDGGTTDATAGGTDGGGGDGGDGAGIGAVPVLAFPLAIGALAVAGLLGYVAVGRRAGASDSIDDAADEAGADEDGAGSGAADEDAAGSGADGDDRVILTDEDRVVDLLESRGGQMHQADVAEELEWSSSKTSRVLSGMAEDGTVEKIRIGRRNVIRFPGDDDADDGDSRDWSDV